jgi:15-cis-phytoene synthase
MTIAACAALVERGDPDRFAATMAAPPKAREFLFPLYAFNLEVARAPWVTQEPLIAEMRLQWWRDVVAAPKSGAALAHEVAGPLHHVIHSKNLPIATLDKLIAARRWDIGQNPFLTTEDLSDYLEDTGAALMWLAAKSLNAPDSAEEAARNVGWATALANYFRAVPDLIIRGRAPVPEASEAAISDLARKGLSRLFAAQASRGTIPSRAAPALYPAWQTRAILTLAAKDPATVAEGRLHQSEFARRGGLAWRGLTGRW